MPGSRKRRHTDRDANLEVSSDKESRPKDFEWYVNNVHKRLCGPKNNKVDLDAANAYANMGLIFLQALLVDKDKKIDLSTFSSRKVASCILWALIRFAYQNGYVFGKGMFNLIFSDNKQENDEIVMRLNNFLCENSYRRPSSHYAGEVTSGLASTSLGVSVVKGLDIDLCDIPYPAEFETIMFAPIKLQEHAGNKDRIALAFKPETQSFDILGRPLHAIGHIENFHESMGPNGDKRTPEATEAHREKPGKVNPNYMPNEHLKGSELIVRVTLDKGLTQEPIHKLRLRSLLPKKSIRPDDYQMV